MSTERRPARLPAPPGTSPACRFLLALALVLPPLLARGAAAPVPAPDTDRKRDAATPDTEVRCTNGTVLRLRVLEKHLTLRTPYGKLLIPFDKVHGFECATRLPEDVTRRIAAGVADLGSPDAKRRESATEALARLGLKAHPALVAAKDSADAEVRRRAAGLVERITAGVEEEELAVRKRDVVETEDSMISGEIETATLRVATEQFGELQLKLSDVRGARSLLHKKEERTPDRNVLADVGHLHGLLGRVGETFSVRVTGAAGGPVWGTDVYTLDSRLASAAVHAGLVKVGATGVVKVRILPPTVGFVGSLRNGIASEGHPNYPGAFEFVKKGK